jgi:hypothetical protein
MVVESRVVMVDMEVDVDCVSAAKAPGLSACQRFRKGGSTCTAAAASASSKLS